MWKCVARVANWFGFGLGLADARVCEPAPGPGPGPGAGGNARFAGGRRKQPCAFDKDQIVAKGLWIRVKIVCLPRRFHWVSIQATTMWVCCLVIEISRHWIRQNTPRYHIQVLPARRTDSETVYFSHMLYLFMKNIVGEMCTCVRCFDKTPERQWS